MKFAIEHELLSASTDSIDIAFDILNLLKNTKTAITDDHFADVSKKESERFADASKTISADIPNDKYLTITADDITIGGESTTEYNDRKIWSRDGCMEYVKDASELFTKEHGASLLELHVVQANNVAGNPIPDTNGKCAWLRCVFNANGVRRITPWIYYTTYGSVAACGSLCADDCGYYVRFDTSFRGSVFGLVGN